MYPLPPPPPPSVTPFKASTGWVNIKGAVMQRRVNNCSLCCCSLTKCPKSKGIVFPFAHPVRVSVRHLLIECSFVQESMRSFLRELEEKRAVIENNLLTGKQHLAALGTPSSNQEAFSDDSGGESES